MKKILFIFLFLFINLTGCDRSNQDSTDNKDYSDEQIIEKVRNDIGADFLGYNDPENLALAIGIPLDSMCFTCATGNYSSLGIKPTFR